MITQYSFREAKIGKRTERLLELKFRVDEMNLKLY